MKISNKEDFLKEKQKLLKTKNLNNKIQVLIGYGTCGIAAGAKEVEKVLKEHLEKSGINNITIKQVGCIGFCYAEPTIEIVHPNGDSVLLGNFKPENTPEIVDLHIKDINHDSKYVIHRNFDYSLLDGGIL